MDLSSVKSVSPNRKFMKKAIALLFSILVIVISFIILNNSNKAAKNTVKVLRVNQSGGLPAYGVITEKQIEKYDLIKKEYTDDMILAKDLPEVIEKYTKYYIRDKSILYKDQISTEKPQRNDWLYKVEDDREVLTLPYNFLEAGGDILMPGDRVRIRVSYEAEGGGDPYANPNAAASSSGKMKTEILFDSIVVKDMLNANSHSIYEVYQEVLKLGEDERDKVMKSTEFLKNIQPRALMLEGSKEEITKFASYNNKEGKKFLITILSRNESNPVVDQLPTLQREVESWAEKDSSK
ncbi:flagellar biosynthesis protein FlgA [Paenibacillus sp. CAA11]|uniref:flagellar biosynthesis protein FlgA n=1 Tax=Paenibacillus sp. CAA11 TaxID=1532905 RepID=UPI000D3AB12B|nr:flagellar biosynthesis protein FlgA [Paenibacillus sp. CAA11]AWB43132.1 flagellar biosynthesis protein FlgA [Paenibacillus sp. CAA11]